MIKCGFYEREITPPLGCHIPGYFNLRQGSNVKDRLYARAMVIQGSTNTLAVVSAEGCTLPPEMSLRDIIAKRVKEYTNIPEENIIFAFTHTHTGIPVYKYDGDENAVSNQEGYWEVTSKLIADCIILAYYRLEDSSVYFGKGEVKGISFCRNFIMKNTTPSTNPTRTSPDIVEPAAEIEYELPVLFIKNSCGAPIGALISFACHPDCVDGTEYSGDYISEMAKQLKKVYGEDFVSVFLLGACGNINHIDVSRKSDAPDHFRMMGRVVAGEVVKTAAKAAPVELEDIDIKYELFELGRREISEEAIANAKHITETIKMIPGIKIAADNTDPDQYNLVMAQKLLEVIETTPERLSVILQAIKIGDVKLYTMPSEIFNDFGQMIKKGADTEKCIVATMCNISYGYVPTENLIYDTIYEARPGSNRLEIKAGEKMAKKLLEMGR